MAKSVFLEVDTSIRDNNLRITRNDDDELKHFQGNSLGQLPPIAVQPTAGFCVKSRELSGKKIFINFCATDRIPAPNDISDDELIELLNTDEDTGYRVPMSIGEVHLDKDKGGDEVNVCDIAINGAFLQKVQANVLLKQFVIAIGFEGYQSKFAATVTSERITLKNKKAMGTLRVHHIQQRHQVVRRSEGEIISHGGQTKKTGMIQVMGTGKIEPKFRFIRKTGNDGTLYAEFSLPYVTSGNDITLDVGEDRIVLETTKGNYFVDTFHEFRINRNESYGEFDQTRKFLTLTMPLINS